MRVLQITDTHLFKNNHDEMFGVKPNRQLKKLINHLLSLNLLVDMIFLTGDVSQDMSPESYQYAVAQLSRFKKVTFWIPGNHDNVETMSTEFNKSDFLQSAVVLEKPDWVFIFLNTKYKDLDSGYFHKKDEHLIAETMNVMRKDKNACIVMHHHPIKTNTPLIDHYILENLDEFWKTINRYPNIKNIICGHVHGDYTLKQGDVTIHAAMASCLQWARGTEKIVIDKTIGCKLYEFNANSVTTKTIKIDESICSNE